MFQNKLFRLLFFISTTTSIFAQNQLTGTVIEGDTKTPLPGVNITISGQNIGTTTDFDGNFSIQVNQKTGILRISYVGFKTREITYDNTNGNQNLGEIILNLDNQLEEVMLIGVVDIAKDRETPVAVSTIRSADIQEKLGSQELPEILNNTPSVYATRQGGGFGDARINVRGFDQRNTAVLINGIPVNDMENGSVYWSNWAGLSDVTSAMQVQRGLGSSKLAISSVGGTINILTKSADRKTGGFISTSVGNNDYLKTVMSYNTGLSDKGWSASFLASRTAGDGYVNGTTFEGYNYFVNIGYKPSANQDFSFTLTGAPQQHNQRGFAPSISDYVEYGDGVHPNRKYNSDWGRRNGREFTFSGNFYHKPIASLNWVWNASSKSTLSASIYASYGRGGSIGSIGRIDRNRSFGSALKTAEGLIRVDDIIRFNQGLQIDGFPIRQTYSGGGNPNFQGLFINGNNSVSRLVSPSDDDHINGLENGISQRSSINSHNWLGGLINFNQQINTNWSFDIGLDLRTYKGIHYRRLVDLLGADFYVDNDNKNDLYRFLNNTYSPTISNTLNVFSDIDKEAKIDFYNDGNVDWAGVFGQLEYKNEEISVFVQASASNQSFQRVDYFNYLDTDPEQKSKVKSILGGNIKGGLNWKINSIHHAFVNAGYYSKQPLFDAVFPSFTSNEINTDLKNEKITGLELGYGYRTQYFQANLNLYRTSWRDRFQNVSTNIDVNNTPNEDNDDIRGSANLFGIEQVHLGIEADFKCSPLDQLEVNGQLSYGKWEYQGNPSSTLFDESNQPILVNGIEERTSLDLDGVKVGDAPQLTASLGAAYKITPQLKIDANYRYIDLLYADFMITELNEKGALQLPYYDLVDAGMSFTMHLSNANKLTFRLNIYNVFDRVYISEAETNRFAEAEEETFKGIANSNRVFFGAGRTWNASLRYAF